MNKEDLLPTRQEGILFTIDCLNSHKYNFDYNLEELIKEAKKLQSNWNSLRECIETNNKRAKGYIERIRTSDLCHGDYPVEYYYAEKRKEITDYYLDKMNELEGKEK